MNSESSSRPEDAGDENLRQLIARNKTIRAGRRRWIASVASLLENRGILLIATGICLLIAVFSVRLIWKTPSEDTVSANSVVSGPLEPLLTDSDLIPHRPEWVGEEQPSAAAEAFIVRVGSFRDPSNARRVTESLQQKSLNPKSQAGVGGLHVVVLGPFAARDAAENAARSVRETVNLVPLVIRRK